MSFLNKWAVSKSSPFLPVYLRRVDFPLLFLAGLDFPAAFSSARAASTAASRSSSRARSACSAARAVGVMLTRRGKRRTCLHAAGAHGGAEGVGGRPRRDLRGVALEGVAGRPRRLSSARRPGLQVPPRGLPGSRGFPWGPSARSAHTRII